MKRETKIFWKDIQEALTFRYENISTISERSETTWEACKNCLETLEYLSYIKCNNEKTKKYKSKQFIDLDSTFRELLLLGLKNKGLDLKRSELKDLK